MKPVLQKRSPPRYSKVSTAVEVITIDDGSISAETFQTTSTRKLCNWDELPEWQKDNEHIISGYVRETNSFNDSFKSLFYIHNESINIYSHLMPGLGFLFTCLFDKYAIKLFPTTGYADYFFINLFFLGAFACLVLSSMFHCFKSHSLRIASFGNKLDYLGIVILIVTSMVSILYYGFYDSYIMFYLFSSITVAFGSACAVVSLEDKFRTREWRPYRAGLFVAFGLSAILPILNGFIFYGFRETWTRVQLKWVLAEGFFYILGAFLYGIRFPERYSPGKYDIWGHSHQIFHILVVVAALCHLKGLMSSYEYIHTYVI